MALNFNNVASEHIVVASNAAHEFGSNDFSVSLWVRSRNTPSANATIIGKQSGTARWELQLDTDWGFRIETDTGNPGAATASTPTELTDGNWHHWLLEREVGVALRVYMDNTLFATASDPAGSLNVAGANFYIGAGGSAGGAAADFWDGNGDVVHVAVFDRILAADERKSLSVGFSPILLGVLPTIYIPVSGRGGEPELISGIAVTPTGSPSFADGPEQFIASSKALIGNPIPLVVLAGDFDGQSTFAAELINSIPLQSSIDAQSTLDIPIPDLEIFVRMQGSIDGSSSIGPSELINDIPLQGSVIGSGVVIGDFAPIVRVRGFVDGQSNVDGNLGRVPLAMSGSISGQSSVVEPVLQIDFAFGDASIDGFGLLAVPGAPGFEGNGMTLVPLGMQGSVDATGIVDGDESVFKNIDGSITTTGTITAGMTLAALAVDGSIDGVSSIAADILLSEEDIKGSINATSAIQGAMSLPQMTLLPFPLIPQSDLSGTLNFPSLKLPDGQSDGVGDLTGNLFTKRAIQGQVDGQSSLQAPRVDSFLALSGAISGASVFAGTLQEILSVSGSIAASAALTATLFELEKLPSGTIQAQSSLAADLRLIEGLQGQVDAISNLVSSLALQPLALQGEIVEGSLMVQAPSVLPIITVDPGDIEVPENPTGEVGSPTSGGYLMIIVGSGFRLPPSPPPGFVGGSAPQMMAVEFDGISSSDVRVLSETRMTAVVPSYSGDADISPIPPVDIRIVALDPDTGDELTGIGDELILSDAFTYRRPKFGSSTNLKRLTRELLRTLKRQIHPNVSLTVDVDYDDTVSDMLDIIKVSELPAIVVRGPTLVSNRFYSINDGPMRQDGREFSRSRPPRTVDLNFEIAGIADKTAVILDMMGEIEKFFEINKTIEMDRDSEDPSQGVVSYEMDIVDELAIETRANQSNIRQLEGSFVIRGFDIELPEEVQSYELDDGDGCVTIEIEAL